jgi:phosphonopyruvate decarboxylase
MLEPADFVKELQKYKMDFFTGVPDSLLKSLCAYISDNFDSKQHIITANEGNAIALAAGHYLATKTIPFVYMQNSGQGNTINPLLSLADKEVYQIPMLLCIGWRGEPGVKDEPQHIKQGKVTLSLLDVASIPYQILSEDINEAITQIEEAFNYLNKENSPYALVVRKGIFADYKIQNNSVISGQLNREEAIEAIVKTLKKDAIVVSTTGMASRELYEIREKRKEGHHKDFLTVGSMGHTSQIALGIALNKINRQVICIDGDGSVLMHLGSMATIGTLKPINLIHIILNNGSHDSVGGQPTVAREINLCSVATSLGYTKAIRIESKEELINTLKYLGNGPVCIEVIVKKGNRKNLGRPKTTPVENKQAFMKYLNEETK